MYGVQMRWKGVGVVENMPFAYILYGWSLIPENMENI